MSSTPTGLQNLTALFRSRLSWRIVCWIFVSIAAIETVLMVPSVQQRRQELLHQVAEVSDGKVEWILKMFPDATGAELFDRVQQLYGDPMLTSIVGGVVYEPDGDLVDSFGEMPTLPLSVAQQGGTKRVSDRYDVAWNASLPSGQHTIVIRHNIVNTQSALRLFILQQGAIMLMISACVTLVMMVVLWPNLIQPILLLRRDLAKAGEAVTCDRPTQFASTATRRQDELGEVIATFQAMYTQICQAVTERKRIEGDLRQHNQQMQEYLSEVNQVTQAAVDLEAGMFKAEDLDAACQRRDELGQLARVFQHAAREVVEREAKLQQQLSELRVEIDQTKRDQEVAKITQSDYFQEIQGELAGMKIDEFWQ